MCVYACVCVGVSARVYKHIYVCVYKHVCVCEHICLTEHIAHIVRFFSYKLSHEYTSLLEIYHLYLSIRASQYLH